MNTYIISIRLLKFTEFHKIFYYSYRLQVKGLPPSLKSRSQLEKFLKEVIWILVEHAAVSYPIQDFGSVTPIMPLKLYNDPRAKAEQNSIYNLPDRFSALVRKKKQFFLGVLVLKCSKLQMQHSAKKFDTTTSLRQKVSCYLIGELIL